MVGQFLELSIAARPLGSSFDFYTALGFSSVPAADTLPDPYVVCFDGNVAIGLHDRDQTGILLTFVRPGLSGYVRALRRLGIELDYAQLAEDEFNRVGFSDPTGQSVVLLEARTFSPGDWNTQNVPVCGVFIEYSLPTRSLAESQAFWEALGFTQLARGDAPHPWLRLTGHGLVIGLHEAHFRPGLSFRSEQLDARLEYLQAKGIGTRARNPLADRGQSSATIMAPEGTSIYLLEAGSQ